MSGLWCRVDSTISHYVSLALTMNRIATGCSRAVEKAVTDKQMLKKAETPQGRFDSAKKESKDEKFPDDVNPITKEKGGPRGPEPTRYGDWERKGRCVDF